MKNLFAKLLSLVTRAEPVRWDDLEAEKEKFPLDQWEHIPVTCPDEGLAVIARLCMERGQVMFGQARWGGPYNGIVFVERTSEPVDAERWDGLA